MPRLGREETLQKLANMGLSEVKARTLVRSTARRLLIMRRRLVDEAGGPTPDWASSSTPHSLVALVLFGQWSSDHEGDKAIVAEIVGKPHEEVERDLTGLMSIPDSPLTKVGNRWRLTSHEEAWHLLAPRLTSSDVERFEQVATSVFGAVSPEFELPVEERYMANVYGKILPHSGTLRDGMARSLALMGTQAERAKNAEGASYVPARVVSNALGGGDEWQTWATLSGSLTELAEAAPETLLDAVERDLATHPSPFEDLFHQEGDGLFGGAPHTGLLWALELLAWSPDHFARVCCRGRSGASYAGAAVDVLEGLDGQLAVRYQGEIIASQEAPPRPGILRSFNGSSSHGTPSRPDLNGLSRRWEAALAALDAQMDAGDTAIDNGAVRVRKAPAMQRRKPTPLQTPRWNAVQKAKRRGLSIRGVARELGIHRDTAKKYMEALSPPMKRDRVV